MTTARHIVTLLKSHIAGDEDRFLATAMQLAAHEARQGHGKLAQDLKNLIDAAKSRDTGIAKSARPVPLVQPKGELAGLLHARYPDLRLTDMILPDSLRARLQRVLGEQRQQASLREQTSSGRSARIRQDHDRLGIGRRASSAPLHDCPRWIDHQVHG